MIETLDFVRSARLAADLARHRIRFAATANTPTDQLRSRPKPPATGPRRGVPRWSRPVPTPSRQYVKTLPTQVIRDQRLTPMARSCAVLIVACAGHAPFVDLTRGYLADRLGVSGRTVGRALQQLRTFGYVATCHTLGDRGETTGLRVFLLGPLLPYWEQIEPSPASQGRTVESPLECFKMNQRDTYLPARRVVYSYPQFRRSKTPKDVPKMN